VDDVDDRRVGALVGLAVGDALGAAVEFRAPGTFPPVTGYRGGGPHPIPPGAWTDDTSMALALADSIASVGWDLDDQARRYVAWMDEGAYSVIDRCFDIGTTTAAALARWKRHGDARSSGGDSPRTAANGSIMRLAPVPISCVSWYPDRLADVVERCIESSLPTHREPRTVAACGYLGAILVALIGGEAREVVLDPAWWGRAVSRSLVPPSPEIDAVIAGSYRDRAVERIRGSGYVVESLEAALWAFTGARDFAGAVLAAVNLGDDADTTGAVCGQLAGAYWGLTGIPDDLRSGLVRGDEVEAAARRLVGVRHPEGR
jgi:ADP-ribosyl-[dinitrogen reductase] hydrolase